MGILNSDGSLFEFAVAASLCVYSLDKLASLQSLKYNSAGNQVVSNKLGDNKIEKVKETETLGVIVDDQLKWNSHIDTVATKVLKDIGMIRRMKAFVRTPVNPNFYV